MCEGKPDYDTCLGAYLPDTYHFFLYFEKPLMTHECESVRPAVRGGEPAVFSCRIGSSVAIDGMVELLQLWPQHPPSHTITPSKHMLHVDEEFEAYVNVPADSPHGLFNFTIKSHAPEYHSSTFWGSFTYEVHPHPSESDPEPPGDWRTYTQPRPSGPLPER